MFQGLSGWVGIKVWVKDGGLSAPTWAWYFAAVGGLWLLSAVENLAAFQYVQRDGAPWRLSWRLKSDGHRIYLELRRMLGISNRRRNSNGR